jgi:hypothetical protein
MTILKHHKNNSIVPFCILQYINPQENIYRGIIKNSIPIKNKDGNLVFNCSEKDEQIFKKWRLVGVFYAISPMFRPIPYGMKLYCTEYSISSPIRTTNIHLNYDLFDFKKNCTYFTTYNTPTINTVPLYFHRLGTNVFPSFDKHQPTTGEWVLDKLSPIYVMINIDPNNAKFYCYNGKCISWNKSDELPFVSNINIGLLSQDITECVVSCDKVQVSPSKPTNILFSIQKQTKKILDKNVFIITIFLIVMIIIVLVDIIKSNLTKKEVV